MYYGYRLGEPVPWVTGFPFSVVPHPQYFGVCCCVIGVNVFTATKAHIAAGWFNLTAVQVLAMDDDNTGAMEVTAWPKLAESEVSGRRGPSGCS